MSGGFSRRSVLRAAALTATGSILGARGAAAAPPDDRPAVPFRLKSPNHRIEVKLVHSAQGLTWAVEHDGVAVVLPSSLGLRLASGAELGPGARRGKHHRYHYRGSWAPPYGRHAELPTDCQELRIELLDPATGIEFAVVARAYDAGAAIRYILLTGGALELAGELTRFRLPSASRVWVSRDEGAYSAVAPNAIPVTSNGVTDVGRLADNPVTAELADGRRLSIAESAREHYPRLLLATVDDDPDALAAYLATSAGRGGGPSEPTFSVATPFETPWRTVTVGATGTELIDNADLVTTLGNPSVLEDTSWIRPGKAYRCTTLTTAGGLASVDLAVNRGVQYVHFDAGWYGPEFDSRSDATRPIPALDLQRVIAYARERGVGITLYVNRLAAERQIDDIVRLYEQWGIGGIKFGFLREGTQTQNDWIFDSIRKFGEHRLLVNAHDNLRPAGLERTLPNYITLEGVRGNEQFPTATHNVTLPFARNLSGPIDYTVCYRQPRLQTTSAHQLAMAAVYYSALEWLYWYAPPTQFLNGPAELEWFDKVPTTWHESRALSGDIGEYVVIARRHGDTWYLGAMTNEQPRTLDIPLDFLRSGAYTAHVYADGAPTPIPRDTPVVMRQETVATGSTVTLELAPAGGQAVRLEPA